MPGWYRACQIGRSATFVVASPIADWEHLLHFEFRVYVWLVHSCVQFPVSADWEVPGKWVPPIGELSQN